MRAVPAKDRFEARLIITPGCWLWTGYRDKKGYGRLAVNRKSVGAHRLSYEMYVGPIAKGLIVCHACDNPRCVNPDHLWLGTDKLNAEDKMAKGRWSNGERRSGELHPCSRLTEAEVLSIRGDQRPASVLAKEYGILISHVGGIKKRRIWKHLPERDCDVQSVDGRSNKSGRYSKEQVAAIRADPRPQSRIAMDYGTTQATISKIKLGGGCYGRSD